jgi:hypothetical protein
VARIDGAGAWRRFRNVTLPLLGPTLAFVVPIAILNALTQVDHVVTMTQEGPADATNLLLYYIYQQAAQNYDVGLASSATVISVAGLLALSLISFRLIEHGRQEPRDLHGPILACPETECRDCRPRLWHSVSKFDAVVILQWRGLQGGRARSRPSTRHLGRLDRCGKGIDQDRGRADTALGLDVPGDL